MAWRPVAIRKEEGKNGMPLYEYKCFNCEKVFIVAFSLSEWERGAIVRCPACDSKDVRRLISAPNVKTASKTG